MEVSNQHKNYDTRRKGNVQIGNIGSWHHPTGLDERNSLKSISGERERYLRQNYLAGIL